jgi:hypothetical protein
VGGWEVLRWVNLCLAAALVIVIAARATARARLASRIGLAVVLGWVAVDTAITLTGAAVGPGWHPPVRTALLLLSGYWLWTDYRHEMAETRVRVALAALIDGEPTDPV